jgi:hypothetical protein
MDSATARWRTFGLSATLISLILLCACHHIPKQIEQSSPAPVRANSVFHFTVENHSRVKDRLSVTMDGAQIANAELRPGEKSDYQIPAPIGWHMIRTASSSGSSHQAIVQADREKWILIRREPGKNEGIGFHVTEYKRH